VTTTPAPPSGDTSREQASPPPSKPRGRIGLIVAGSLVIGFVAALLFVFAPFTRPEEAEVTGAVLCGFALGWALLAVLSMRFTDQPQRWAEGPAVFFGLCGLLLLVLGASVHDPLQWVWPPALLVLSVWMLVSVRQHLHSRSGRWLLYPVIVFLMLASVGGGYETVGAAVDARDHAARGRLIDVDGHQMHLRCTGTGSPTVVLEPGAGSTSADTEWIARAVAGETRVCVYDRAGRGWSEPADGQQDARRVATDLHTLLQRAEVPGPYVLAGHSFGGLYVETFAARYPDQVAGLVLVDSTAPSAKPGVTPPRDDSYDAMGRFSALMSVTARLGLLRLYGLTDYNELPPQSRDEARVSVAKAEHVRSVIDEYVQGGNSANEAAALDDFGDKPLVVLTAGVGSDAEWMVAQDKLAALSTNSAHRVVDGASHGQLFLEKEPAAATTEAVLDVVAAVRSSGQLAQ
jgi:pimeloyl-ACP methyl ester carboxylesterase